MVYEVFALSSLSSIHTGVDGAVLWISAGEFADDDSASLGPRLLVVQGKSLTASSLWEAILVTLEEPPSILGNLPATIERQVVKFIEANRTTLISHWRGELDSGEALSKIKPI